MDAFPAVAPGVNPVGTFPPAGDDQPKRAHLYIGNLSPRVTEYMLNEIFSVAGTVQGVKIVPDRSQQNGGVNYGFVEYYELRAAETALQTLNGRKIFDLEIKCNWAYQNQASQNKEDLTGHNHLFVGDLPPEVTDEVLRKTFSAFGSLSDCRVMWDPATAKSRGYGFLAFREKADAEQAIATMNGEWLGSRAIRVNWANSKSGGEGGPATGGGGGGGGGGSGGARDGQSGGGAGGGGGAGYGTATSYEAVVAQTPSFNSTIYVGNLVPYATQADLIPLFQGFGYLVEIRMQSDRGFAFVKLDSHQSAAQAIVNLQGALVHGRGIKLSWGKDRVGGEAHPAPAQPHQQYAQPGYQHQQVAQQYAQPYAQQQAAYPQQQQAAPQDAAAQAAALAAWQAQYGAQYAAYMQQQAAYAQQGGHHQ